MAADDLVPCVVWSSAAMNLSLSFIRKGFITKSINDRKYRHILYFHKKHLTCRRWGPQNTYYVRKVFISMDIYDVYWIILYDIDSRSVFVKCYVCFKCQLITWLNYSFVVIFCTYQSYCHINYQYKYISYVHVIISKLIEHPCYTPLQRSWKGVYWFHVVCLSVHPSVDKIVSALYLP